MLTGGSDGSIQCWRISAAGSGELGCLLASASADDSNVAELVQKIELKGKLPLELALSYLPASESELCVLRTIPRELISRISPGLVLAVGSTENRIQVFSSPTAGGTISVTRLSSRRVAISDPSFAVLQIPHSRRPHRLGSLPRLRHPHPSFHHFFLASRLRYSTWGSRPRLWLAGQLHSPLALLPPFLPISPHSHSLRPRRTRRSRADSRRSRGR